MSRAKLFKAAAAVGAAGVAGAALGTTGQAFAQSKDNNFVATGLPNGIGFDADARDKQGAPVFSEGVVGAGTSDGVRGTSDTGSGVTGYAYAGGIGVFGYGVPGVQGVASGASAPAAPPRAGVYGTGTDGVSLGMVGVEGISDTSDGVLGTSRDGSGVHGLSDQGSGVAGNSSHGNGVAGRSSKSDGVFGESFDDGHAGLAGQNHGSGSGVRGVSAEGNGVEGSGSGSGAGVYGISDRMGLYGQSPHGRGGVFSGKLASVRLVPSTANHPSSGSPGDIFVDSGMRMWFCVGGSRWKRVV
jgi:hypothetical protein